MKLIVFKFESIQFFKKLCSSNTIQTNDNYIVSVGIIITTADKMVELTREIRKTKACYDVNEIDPGFLFNVKIEKMSTKCLSKLNSDELVRFYKAVKEKRVTVSKPVKKKIEQAADKAPFVNTDIWRYHEEIAPEGMLFTREQSESLPEDWVDTPAKYKN